MFILLDTPFMFIASFDFGPLGLLTFVVPVAWFDNVQKMLRPHDPYQIF